MPVLFIIILAFGISFAKGPAAKAATPATPPAPVEQPEISLAVDSVSADIPSGISPEKDSFWTKKNIFSVASFTLSAASLGLGIWQNHEADKKGKKSDKLYMEATKEQGKPGYTEKYLAYRKNASDIDKSQMLRNGFYISAGVLGLAGGISVFF